jgi:hypothetical protein
MFELGPEQLVKALEQPAVVIDLIFDEIKKQGLDGLVSSCCTRQAGMTQEHMHLTIRAKHTAAAQRGTTLQLLDQQPCQCCLKVAAALAAARLLCGPKPWP